MKRFYPDHIPVVPNEPCWDDFCVLDVDEVRGQGVLVLREFAAGSVLFRMNGTHGYEMTLHSLQMGPNLHLDDPYFAGKVLHSCEPNSWLDVATGLFFATRDIADGELLTMDYDETEDVLFRSFECQCGSPCCRGTIVGRRAKRVPAQRRWNSPASVSTPHLPAEISSAVLAERQNAIWMPTGSIR